MKSWSDQISPGHFPSESGEYSSRGFIPSIYLKQIAGEKPSG